MDNNNTDMAPNSLNESDECKPSDLESLLQKIEFELLTGFF